MKSDVFCGRQVGNDPRNDSSDTKRMGTRNIIAKAHATDMHHKAMSVSCSCAALPATIDSSNIGVDRIIPNIQRTKHSIQASGLFKKCTIDESCSGLNAF